MFCEAKSSLNLISARAPPRTALKSSRHFPTPHNWLKRGLLPPILPQRSTPGFRASLPLDKFWSGHERKRDGGTRGTVVFILPNFRWWSAVSIQAKKLHDGVSLFIGRLNTLAFRQIQPPGEFGTPTFGLNLRLWALALSTMLWPLMVLSTTLFCTINCVAIKFFKTYRCH